MQQYKICTVCGERFKAGLTSNRKTCSPQCASSNRRTLAKSGLAKKMSKKALELQPSNPLLGRFETHIHAKEWAIKSPEGQVFRCRNLLNWLREHEDMLDGTIKQAFVGFSQIKRSMKGASKRNNRTWKGWTVVDWGE
ncbi:hypothetical protein WGM54_14135 [Paenibacillus polymyxa]|uniref:hypothetical protein n=1 Tax=Paenibacillus polymyxa TaxID=1406 RepID=UPI00307FA2CB